MKHSDGHFKGAGGLSLYYQFWLPDGEPKAILIVGHGLAEHSGRYANLVNYLVPRYYGVYSYDQRGHGKSEGMRGYVTRFSDFLDDMKIFSDLVRKKHPGVKTFLLGHSLGTTIAAAFAAVHPDKFDGLILGGTLLNTPDHINAGTLLAARCLSVVFPKAGLYVLDADAICQNKEIVKAYITDPLVYRGKIRARLGVEIIKGMAAARGQLGQIRLPVMVMHGKADRLSDPRDSEFFYNNVGSEDKTLKIYEGYYHEIFNEPGHERVLVDLEAWLTAHILDKKIKKV